MKKIKIKHKAGKEEFEHGNSGGEGVYRAF